VSLLRKSQQKQTPKPHQHQQLNNSEADDNDGFEINDEVTFGRNRRSGEFGKVVDDDVDVSDYIRLRLALARALAMEAYEKAQA
jgi:hypothetical protein